MASNKKLHERVLRYSEEHDIGYQEAYRTVLSLHLKELKEKREKNA